MGLDDCHRLVSARVVMFHIIMCFHIQQYTVMNVQQLEAPPLLFLSSRRLALPLFSPPLSLYLTHFFSLPATILSILRIRTGTVNIPRDLFLNLVRYFPSPSYQLPQHRYNLEFVGYLLFQPPVRIINHCLVPPQLPLSRWELGALLP